MNHGFELSHLSALASQYAHSWSSSTGQMTHRAISTITKISTMTVKKATPPMSS
jgi:hypothetical protein